MFDRSLLPKPRLEFVVVSDTHYLLDPGTRAVEFESRRLQTPRTERVLGLIAGLNPSFVVHLGDLVQEHPEAERFELTVSEARRQLERCGLQPRHVAGNCDVGDKPDPTMPTDWVTPESLAGYHAYFGRSWYSWDAGGVHCVVLNSQILNTALPQAEDQRGWAESDLRAHTGQRIVLFLHLPPFLENEHEPALGHYDNIAEPARGWLLSLVRQHKVELVFTGHTHFAFFNRIDRTRCFVAAPSTFTRPGFSEAFSSGPPPERGRDDVSKLGFYLIRVQDDGVRVHFIRTNGATSAVDRAAHTQSVIARDGRDLPHSPLGLTLRHPLAQTVEVPSVWPSVIRQRVRNDYPLLACMELGVRHLRVPASDLADDLQRRRLAILREEGVKLTATWLWSELLDLPAAVARHRKQLDSLEIQLPGDLWPAEGCLQQAHTCATELGLPVALFTGNSPRTDPGKAACSCPVGLSTGGIAGAEPSLVPARGSRSPRALPGGARCQSLGGDGPGCLERSSLSHVGAVDWVVAFTTTDEHEQIVRAAEALFASALLPGSRLFLEPLVDLDRTMDVANGLLDRLYNPRPAFRVVRCLNTILFGAPEVRHPVIGPALDGARLLGLAGARTTSWLLLPLPPRRGRLQLELTHLAGREETSGDVRCFHLEQGTSRLLGPPGAQTVAESFSFDEATLLMFSTGESVNSAHDSARLSRKKVMMLCRFNSDLTPVTPMPGLPSTLSPRRCHTDGQPHSASARLDVCTSDRKPKNARHIRR